MVNLLLTLCAYAGVARWKVATLAGLLAAIVAAGGLAWFR